MINSPMIGTNIKNLKNRINKQKPEVASELNVILAKEIKKGYLESINDKKNNMLKFLESLESNTNKNTIDVIKKGFENWIK